MRRMLPVISVIATLLLVSDFVLANDSGLRSALCFPSIESPVTNDRSAKEITIMSKDTHYRAPSVSARLDTLDVLGIGVSLDVFRQGQVWQVLQEQSATQSEALHVGSVLPKDISKYPVTSSDKDMAYNKRKTDSLELGVRDFLEKWPIPTITVVRGWKPSTSNLRFPQKEQRRC